jgi:hypothetical protein
MLCNRRTPEDDDQAQMEATMIDNNINNDDDDDDDDDDDNNRSRLLVRAVVVPPPPPPPLANPTATPINANVNTAAPQQPTLSAVGTAVRLCRPQYARVDNNNNNNNNNKSLHATPISTTASLVATFGALTFVADYIGPLRLECAPRVARRFTPIDNTTTSTSSTTTTTTTKQSNQQHAPHCRRVSLSALTAPTMAVPTTTPLVDALGALVSRQSFIDVNSSIPTLSQSFFSTTIFVGWQTWSLCSLECIDQQHSSIFLRYNIVFFFDI